MNELWKTMETAPCDGMMFLSFCEHEGKHGIAVTYWNGEAFVETISGKKLPYLTYWATLPKEPE